MSQIHDKSPKHCAQKQAIKLHKFKKKIFFYLSIFILTILSLVILVWFIFHPSKPQFSLEQSDFVHLNITPPFINSTIHVTFSCNNPNKRVGIYYDEIATCASYKGQTITLDTSIPQFYQDHQETNFLSAVLVGNQMPLVPYFAYQARRDRRSGKMALNYRVSGRVRWKVGSWVSKRHKFSVSCVTIVHFRTKLSLSHSIESSECFTAV